MYVWHMGSIAKHPPTIACAIFALCAAHASSAQGQQPPARAHALVVAQTCVCTAPSEITASDTLAPATTVPPLTFDEKASLYARRTFSVRAVLGASFAAALAQWHGTPEEWGAGLKGYERRDAAAFGGGVVRNSTSFALGALLHEDPREQRSSRDGFTARTEDALHNAMYARNDDGGQQIAWSRVAASFATGFAVNSWEPRRMHSTHHAMMLSLGGLASYATGSFMREFTPDIKRFLLRHVGRDATH